MSGCTCAAQVRLSSSRNGLRRLMLSWNLHLLRLKDPVPLDVPVAIMQTHVENKGGHW